jgi:AraC-like DNA-binding protein
MADLIRSACLTHFAEVARSVGVDPKTMLRRVKLPPACLEQPNMRIAVSSVRRLLEATAAAADIDDFGLRMAERGGLSNFGPVALIVREQATVGAALDALSRYVHIHDEAMSVTVDHEDDAATIQIFLRGNRPRASRQPIEMAVATVYRIIRSLIGEHWRAQGVHFVHSAPRNLAHYRRFFGCKVTFNSSFDGIVCAPSDMAHPIPTADPQIARYVQSGVDAITINRRSEDWDTKVSELVRLLLPSGQVTIQRIAEILGYDRRTIHRRLADYGTSFSEILDVERAGLVQRLIEDSNRPLSEIAELLGFSSQSAMARWFRGRFGASISQWRSGVRPALLRPETV